MYICEVVPTSVRVNKQDTEFEELRWREDQMAVRSITPPPLQVPTAKEKKYDRQLRLWAASGQRALEEANVLLLNSGAGAVGFESLKNLILPGVGTFTIVDEANVTESDLGVNFFLAETSLGRPRAEEGAKYLNELNPDVCVHAVQESIEVYVSRKYILDQYSLILLIGPITPLSTLWDISGYASRRSIPLFYIHSVGFYSHFSVQLPAQFPVVDTHPDPDSTQDLRLLNTWPELLDFVHLRTNNLESLDDHEHGHVPYLLLLLHYLNSWRASHGGRSPDNYGEKKDFKNLVQNGARTANAEGGEENYAEAVASVLKSLNPPSISSGLQDIFEADECKLIRSDSPNFWVIAHAIREFHKVNGALPLPGALPDMKAKSADYVQLQNIYKAKARKDLVEVTAAVRLLEKEIPRKSSIDDQEIEAFCKGAAFVKLIKGQPIRNPSKPIPSGWASRARYICQELQDEESLLPVYLSFLAYDYFRDKQNPPELGTGAPTQGAQALQESYTQALKDDADSYIDNLFRSLLQLLDNDDDFDTAPIKARIQTVVAELGRAHEAELHNISALTGGMVAQEVIKVITKQYVPIDNTCVFDGIVSKAAVFRL